jgi:hypothetical protein
MGHAIHRRIGPTRRLAGWRHGADSDELEDNERHSKMAEENKKVSGSALTNAIAVFLPILRALIIEAEASGKSGVNKHAAVAEAAENAYRVLQGSIKELRLVPWMLIAPILVPATGGFITVLVGVFNKLWGKVWEFISRYVGD